MPSHNTYCLIWVSLILDMGYLFTAAAAKRSRCSLPWTRDVSSLPPLLTLNLEQLLSAAPDLGRGVAPLSLSIESLKTLFLVSLEAEPGLCPRATLLFPGCSSFVSASSPLPDGQLFKSALRNSGKVLEAGVCSLQTRNGRQKSHAQEPHRVLLGFLIDPPSLPDHLICPCSWLSKDLITL